MTEDQNPIVVTRDGYMVGSVTFARVQASKEAGNETIPTLILDIDYETATEEERDRLSALAEKLDEDALREITGEEPDQ